MNIKPLAVAALALSLTTACVGGDDDSGTDDSAVDDTGTDDTGTTLGDAPDIADLVNTYGCASVTIGLYSADGHQGLVFGVDDNLPEQSWDAGGTPVTATYDLATQATLVWQVGNNVQALHCNDAWDGTETVDQEWTVVSGTADLQVTTTSATDWDYNADAVLILTNVVMENSGYADVSIDTLTLTANVGWLPG